MPHGIFQGSILPWLGAALKKASAFAICEASLTCICKGLLLQSYNTAHSRQHMRCNAEISGVGFLSSRRLLAVLLQDIHELLMDADFHVELAQFLILTAQMYAVSRSCEFGRMEVHRQAAEDSQVLYGFSYAAH